MRVLADGRVKRTESEWRKILERFEASGLSASAFCRREKIGRGTFVRWRRELRETTSGAMPFVELPRPEAGESAAAGAPWSPAPLASGELELALPGGVRLRFRP